LRPILLGGTCDKVLTVNANYRRSSVPQGCKFHSLSFFAAPIGEDDALHD
jgi:predicted butyrate kinase (DUF1464 family)